MAGESEDRSGEDLPGTAQEFLNFCDEERERRRNSGEEFDESRFEEAVELVLRKLRSLAGEGA